MLQNMKNHEDQYQSSTVVKALDILKAIGAREMNASEICQELSLNKTTAHRLLLTLQNENFIERNEATRKYRIGLSVLELCCSRLSDIELVTETRPFLIDLANAIQKPTHLGIYSSGNVVYVDKIEVLPKITMYSQIGKSIPIHCSSLGKALLLNHTDNEMLSMLVQYGVQAYTQHTITDPSVYLKQIAQGRRNGYTIDFCEHEDGMCCIASPIYDYRGEIIAAISSSCYSPEELQNTDFLSKAASYMRQYAEKISGRLGWNKNVRSSYGSGSSFT